MEPEKPRWHFDPRRLAAVRLGLFSAVDLLVTGGALIACSSRQQTALSHLVLRRWHGGAVVRATRVPTPRPTESSSLAFHS